MSKFQWRLVRQTYRTVDMDIEKFINEIFSRPEVQEVIEMTSFEDFYRHFNFRLWEIKNRVEINFKKSQKNIDSTLPYATNNTYPKREKEVGYYD